jgi:hypothetical protein
VDPADGSTVGQRLSLASTQNQTLANATIYDIAVQGHFAFIAGGDNGIQIVSLKDTDQPYIAGSFNPGGDARDVLVEGNLVVIADAKRGVVLANFTIQPDLDGDRIADSDDDFPSDPTEWRDIDNDGIGNNADTDDDGDGIEDSVDDDIDNDGYPNGKDMYPHDDRYWIDSNGDGVGDNNPLLLVDNESIHSSAQGEWDEVPSSNAFIGSTYLTKAANSSGAAIRWSPIVNDPGRYNTYSAGLHISNPSITQVATYNVHVNGFITRVIFDQDAQLGRWNLLGEFDFPQGNDAFITLVDDGDGSADVYGDAILLIPSLTVPIEFDSNYGYEFVGNYTNEDLRVWNLKRVLIDPLDPEILYGAFNTTADLCSIDISNPVNPRLLNCFISEDDGAGYEIARKGDYLILANRDAGIRVFETTGRGSFNLVATVPTFHKASRVVIEGDILYVGDTTGGLLTYDISSPAMPRFLGRAEIGAEARDIRIKGNYAFVGNYFFGLAVVNVADPTNLIIETRLKEPWNAFLGGVWDLEIRDDHLFMLVQSFGVQIADISNPLDPQVVSEIRLPNGRNFEFGTEIHDDQPPLDLELVNNLLIVSNGAHGVLLFDVTDIDNVQLLDRIDTPSVAGEAKLHGSNLYVADGRGSGLQIYDISAYRDLFEPQE